MFRIKAVFLLIQIGFAGLALAGKDILSIDTVFVGQKSLTLRPAEKIVNPDLTKLSLEGHSILGVFFIEDLDDSLPLKPNPNLWDLSSQNGVRALSLEDDFQGKRLLIETKEGMNPYPGLFLADTSFGGFLLQVRSVERQENRALISGGQGPRWLLRVEKASLPQILGDCDFKFSTDLNLSWLVPDLNTQEELIDESSPIEEGRTGRVNLSVSAARILGHPTLTGRLRIVQGKIQICELSLKGQIETSAEWKAQVEGAGQFHLKRSLSPRKPRMFPLFPGLFLKVEQSVDVYMTAQSLSPWLGAALNFSMKSDFVHSARYGGTNWQPHGEHKLEFKGASPKIARGEGELLFALRPSLTVSLSARDSLGLEMDPHATLRLEMPEPELSKASASLLLGSSVWMRAGKPYSESRLEKVAIYSREEFLFGPPQGKSELKLSAGSDLGAKLQWNPVPNAEFYLIQRKLANEPWRKLMDTVYQNNIDIKNLKSQSNYRFRVFPANRAGLGRAMPEEGVEWFTQGANRPPILSNLLEPLNGQELQPGLEKSQLKLKWSASDENAEDTLRYTLRIDTVSPPQRVVARGIIQNEWPVSDLKGGHNYFWQITVTDGTDTLNSEVQNFLLQAERRPSLRPFAAQYASTLAYIPEGEVTVNSVAQSLRAFYLQKFEVTQKDYRALTGNNPSFRLGDSLPVERVTWQEANNYCQELGGRLPTEAEWEFAARANSRSGTFWGYSDPGSYAWYRANSKSQTHAIGRKKPNPWGLYDMLGNVFEWVSDWYHPKNLEQLGEAIETDTRVVRGASWYSEFSSLSPSYRFNMRPSSRSFKLGFRCAFEVIQSADKTESQDSQEGLGFQEQSQAISTEEIKTSRL